MADAPYVVVVGGANMDIAGRPHGPLVPRDSNIGSVRLSHGGVGRNIAHNLALLGVDVRLMTVFGEDAQADSLVEGCREVGIDLTHSFAVPGASTSTYLYITDEQGEMEVAINDMAILDELTPERVERNLTLLQGAAVVVADANLPQKTLAWMGAHVMAPLFCDPISTAKAARVAPMLGRLHTLKPNLLEACALAGRPEGSCSPAEAADALLQTGLQRAFVSLGADGVLCATHEQQIHLPLLPCNVVNTTGGGDALMAGVVWAHLHGLDLLESGRAGLAASALAVESAQTVSPQMSEAALLERMRA